MNCCCCDNKVDITDRTVPPKWFGRYYGEELLQVICITCIKVPENKEKWGNHEFETGS